MVREDLIGHQRKDTPSMLDWEAFYKAPSKLYNSPASWPLYVMGLNINFLNAFGLDHYENLARKRSHLLYDYIDKSDGFYQNNVDHKCRSRTNIPFYIKNKNEDL